MTSKNKTTKRIHISRNIHKKLHDFSEYGETLEDTVSRLLDEAGDISQDNAPTTGTTQIRLSDETYKRLVSMKITDNEKFSSVLQRAFDKI